MTQNYHVSGEIITRNYHEKLSREIITRNYHEKLSWEIITRNYHLVYYDTNEWHIEILSYLKTHIITSLHIQTKWNMYNWCLCSVYVV